MNVRVLLDGLLPAVFTAFTVNVTLAPPVRPVMVADVVVTDCAGVALPFAKISYPTANGTAVQVRLAVVPVTLPVIVGAQGADMSVMVLLVVLAPPEFRAFIVYASEVLHRRLSVNVVVVEGTVVTRVPPR